MPALPPASSEISNEFPKLVASPSVRCRLSHWAHEALRAATGTERKCGPCVTPPQPGVLSLPAGQAPSLEVGPCVHVLMVPGPLWLWNSGWQELQPLDAVGPALGIPKGARGIWAGRQGSPSPMRGKHSKATPLAVTKATTRASTSLRVGVCDDPESRKPSPLSKRERGESRWPCCPGSLSLTSFS